MDITIIDQFTICMLKQIKINPKRSDYATLSRILNALPQSKWQFILWNSLKKKKKGTL